MEPQEYRHMFELEDRYWWFLGKRELDRVKGLERTQQNVTATIDEAKAALTPPSTT